MSTPDPAQYYPNGAKRINFVSAYPRVGAWGTKGAEYRPDKCEHASDDGCMWCCQQCNTDMHWCPGCGTVSDHKETVCGDCSKPMPNMTTDAGGPHHPDCHFPHEQCICAEIAREFGAEKVDRETFGEQWCEKCVEYHD